MKARPYETCDLMHNGVCVSSPCICKSVYIAERKGKKTEPEQIADLKQQVFKLKSDIDFVRFENAEKDIKFLKEMKEHAIRAYDERDAASHEMVLTMISDWIHQLEKI